MYDYVCKYALTYPEASIYFPWPWSEILQYEMKKLLHILTQFQIRLVSTNFTFTTIKDLLDETTLIIFTITFQIRHCSICNPCQHVEANKNFLLHIENPKSRQGPTLAASATVVALPLSHI